eukprot:TRINITY_DN3241_c0_g1_i18.p1 TRINITY_DN3241_c0_g1~~TRINITY_DN3241_c0_g1_i18.p1  ORF type:complete len:447 (+),score=106.42 TRINITY_DN3241_c0_g1_i18:324-1664(+)
MVMNLLGENLSELRKGKKFSLVVSLKIGLKVIPILESIHALGYVHRDIKPSNFVVGLYPPSSRREIFLIDFGLARRFVTNTGEVRKARDFTGFRGTARYASINSHMCRDLSRRDDMWSVFYLLVEFAKCQLPWSRLRDKDKIGEMKIQWNTPELVRGLPPEFLKFMNHLQSLKFGDPPDYLLLMNLLRGALSNCGETEAAIFGWEKQAPPPRLLTAINFVAAESFGQVLFASGGGRGLTVTSTIDTNLSSTNSKRYRTIVVNPKKPQPPKHLGEDPKSRTSANTTTATTTTTDLLRTRQINTTTTTTTTTDGTRGATTNNPNSNPNPSPSLTTKRKPPFDLNCVDSQSKIYQTKARDPSQSHQNTRSWRTMTPSIMSARELTERSEIDLENWENTEMEVVEIEDPNNTDPTASLKSDEDGDKKLSRDRGGGDGCGCFSSGSKCILM